MKKIISTVILIMIIFLQNIAYASSISAKLDIQTTTGFVKFYIDAVFPVEVYKSIDYVNYELMVTTSSNVYEEQGLSNGTTYYYKFIDSTSDTVILRYTPSYTVINILPLKLEDLRPNQAHFSWTHINAGVRLYLDDVLIYTSTDNSNEYTITGLQPNNQYKVHYLFSDSVRSNTVTFTTPDDYGLMRSALEDLFIPDDVDSNSDGITDNVEPLKQSLDNIVNKMGGTVINNVTTVVDNAANDTYFTGGNERLTDIPKIGINFMSIQGNVFDIQMDFFILYIEQIRNIVLIMLVVGFVYAVLSLFNITWKV